jgi:hypothetical protein
VTPEQSGREENNRKSRPERRFCYAKRVKLAQEVVSQCEMKAYMIEKEQEPSDVFISYREIQPFRIAGAILHCGTGC